MNRKWCLRKTTDIIKSTHTDSKAVRIRKKHTQSFLLSWGVRRGLGVRQGQGVRQSHGVRQGQGVRQRQKAGV